MNKIAIISHTEHYVNKKGKVVGWEPTIREINHFTSTFKIVYHLAPLHLGEPHSANLPYDSGRIIFKPLVPSGGKTLFKKIGICLVFPINLIRIVRVIYRVDCIHFRAPTNLGLYVLPLLYFFYRKKIWIKYAGNWKQNSIPLSYKLQRWWLSKNFNRSLFISSLGSKKYFSTLQFIDGVLGNSSSGIIEAPSLGVLSINVGSRQKGRIKAETVIDSSIDKQDLSSKVAYCISKNLNLNLVSKDNPYEKRDTVSKILEIIVVWWCSFDALH